MPFIKEPDGTYITPKSVTEDEIIAQARSILVEQLKIPGAAFNCPETVKEYFRISLVNHEREVFSCLFLDNKHRLIEYEELFLGTIDQATVHPREIAKAALNQNAAALIVGHNHPSGDPTPSQADEVITKKIKVSLELFDIRLLDHIVVGCSEAVSFAEIGLL